MLCDSEEMEFKVSGYKEMLFEPGYSYFASSNIVKDDFCHVKKTFKVNFIDGNFPVLELLTVDWIPLNRPKR